MSVRGKIGFSALLFVQVFAVSLAGALPLDSERIMFGEQDFDTAGEYAPERICARASYDVYRCPLDEGYEYLYTYRIFNDDSTMGLEFFSVGIPYGTDARSPGFEYDLGANEVTPSMRAIVGQPPQSVMFLFLLDPVNVGEYSALLTFLSDDMPMPGYATLAGCGISETKELPTPNLIPEVSTIALFGLGTLFMLPLKRANRYRLPGEREGESGH